MGVAPSSSLVAGAYAWSFGRSGFPEAHTALSAALLSNRVVEFLRTSNGWYLVDVCYMAHLMNAWWLFRASSEERRRAFKPLYLLSMGWCLWGVVMWRNAVAADVSRLTSTFLHASPGALMYWLRWTRAGRRRFPEAAPSPADDRAAAYRGSLELLTAGMGVWLVSVLAHRAVGATADTSFSYMVRKFASEGLQRRPWAVRLALYIASAWGYGAASNAVALTALSSRAVHAAMMVGVGAVAVRNGRS